MKFYEAKNYIFTSCIITLNHTGRRVPDIFAPGYNVCTSRYTTEIGEDTTINVYGTSFASPNAAGSAALIRQYFTEGWYPCGSKGCSDPIKPSGSLIKAVMLNGAQPVLGMENVFS